MMNLQIWWWTAETGDGSGWTWRQHALKSAPGWCGPMAP